MSEETVEAHPQCLQEAQQVQDGEIAQKEEPQCQNDGVAMVPTTATEQPHEEQPPRRGSVIEELAWKLRCQNLSPAQLRRPWEMQEAYEKQQQEEQLEVQQPPRITTTASHSTTRIDMATLISSMISTGEQCVTSHTPTTPYTPTTSPSFSTNMDVHMHHGCFDPHSLPGNPISKIHHRPVLHVRRTFGPEGKPASHRQACVAKPIRMRRARKREGVS